MKTWNFTFKDDRDGSWGWNSVQARGINSAINKASKWCFFMDYTLDEKSVNSNNETFQNLLMNFY